MRRVQISVTKMEKFLSKERLVLMGDKVVMPQGDKAVIRVTKRSMYSGFGVNVWVRCRKRSRVFVLSLERSGIRVGSKIN